MPVSAKFFASKPFSFLGALAVASVLVCAPSPASAATCSNQTAKVRSINLSSQVVGEQFRLCADWLKTTLIKTKPRVPTPIRVPAGHQPASQQPAPKHKLVPLNRSVLATADRPNILALPNEQIMPDTDVLLFTDATRHSVLRKLLGYDTLIRFTPVGFRWTTGDGGVSTRSRLKHRFSRLGTSFVRLSVDYAIEVRLAASPKWIKTPLRIKKVAEPLPIRIGERRVIQGIPVFVIRNCLARPTAIGCQPSGP